MKDNQNTQNTQNTPIEKGVINVPKNNNFLLRSLYFNIISDGGLNEDILISEVINFNSSVDMNKKHEVGKLVFARDNKKPEIIDETLMSMNGARLFMSYQTAFEDQKMDNIYYIIKAKKVTSYNRHVYEIYFTDFMGYSLASIKSNKKHTGKTLNKILEDEHSQNDMKGEVKDGGEPQKEKYFIDKKYRSKVIQPVGELETKDFVFHSNNNLEKQLDRYTQEHGVIVMAGLHRNVVGKPKELFKMFKSAGVIAKFVKDAHYNSLNPDKYFGVRKLPPNSGTSMVKTPMVSQIKLDFMNKKSIISQRYNMGDALNDDGNGIKLKASSKNTKISSRKILLPNQHKQIENQYQQEILNKNLIELTVHGRMGMDIGSMIEVEINNPISQNQDDPKTTTHKCIVTGIHSKIVDRYFIQTLKASVL